MTPQDDNLVTVAHGDGTFEVFYDAEKAGFMEYNRKIDAIEIIHTEVSEKYGGKGLGKELVKAAVEYAKKNNLKIVAFCPYAKKVIMQNSEYRSLLAE